MTDRVARLVGSQLKGHGREVTPLFLGLFMAILLFNLVGRLPYTQTVTASLAVRLGVRVFVWV